MLGDTNYAQSALEDGIGKNRRLVSDMKDITLD